MVVLVRGRQEKLPDYYKGNKVIGCSIENFVHMIAVTKQKAVPSVEFSSAKGNFFEREKDVEDTMLDLLKSFPDGLEERDASSSTPTAGGDPTHEVVEEQFHDEKLPSIATSARGDTSAKDTKSKTGNIGSQPRGNHTVFTHYPNAPIMRFAQRTKTTRAMCRIKREEARGWVWNFYKMLEN